MGLVGLATLHGPWGCHGCRGWVSNCRVNNTPTSVGAILALSYSLKPQVFPDVQTEAFLPASEN